MAENFFSKLKSAWNFVSDKENVKNLVTKVYTVVQKLLDVLKVMKEFVTDPKFTAHIPAVLSALSTVLAVFSKLAPLIGINLPVQAPSRKGKTLDEAKKELNDALTDLDKVLK